jgi:hypothetical protein
LIIVFAILLAVSKAVAGGGEEAAVGGGEEAAGGGEAAAGGGEEAAGGGEEAVGGGEEAAGGGEEAAGGGEEDNNFPGRRPASGSKFRRGLTLCFTVLNWYRVVNKILCLGIYEVALYGTHTG